MGAGRRFEASGASVNVFEFVVKTDNLSGASSANNQFKLPLVSTGFYDFYINWGDGTENHITAWDQAETLHTFPSIGTYTPRIIGKIEGFLFNTRGDLLKLLEIKSWGTLNLIGAVWFRNCTNLTLANVSGVPKIGSNAANEAFMGTNLTTIKNFDKWLLPSNVTNFFRSAKFNLPLAGLHTSHISIWHSMFRDNLFFNQDISMLDFSSVTDMTNFMTGKSPANYNVSYYDSLLIALDATGKTNVPLGMGAIKYTSAGATARANLVAKGWTITDGGMI